MSDKEIQLNKEVTKAEEIDRRSFLKTAVGAVAGAAIVVKSGRGTSSRGYFTDNA